VGVWCKLRGISSVTELPVDEIALSAILSDVLQLLGVLYIIKMQLLAGTLPGGTTASAKLPSVASLSSGDLNGTPMLGTEASAHSSGLEKVY
jgi:hypothetical protein